MMKQSQSTTFSLLCGVALLTTATLAAAQQERDYYETDPYRTSDRTANQQYQSQKQQYRTQDQQNQSRNQQSMNDEQVRARYKLQPDSSITMAADYDNDGRFDTFETIYYYDYVRAQQANQKRQGASNKQNQGRYNTSGWKSNDSQQQMTSLSGKIENLRKVRLSDSNQEYLVARVDTEQGDSVTALLGGRSDLARLNLSKGDRVSVKGHRGHVNDKSMLIADSVSSGNRSVSVDMPQTRNLKRAKGDIVSTRNVRFRGFDEQFVVAEVELVSGKTETVNLGPQSKVKSLDLQKGDQVKLLVRPGRVNGERAMIAEQIQANGELVSLPRPQDTQRFQRAERDSVS